ncbi:endothelin-converting enzyme 1-like [Musca domestica]|uniref:Endothelin-converting enzyme 1-like n=1 Tax=Musca domestica TaxID=7370 RepID=A0A1I8NEA2_MUSDO|nr:endothelin-converting enzyme 1-like [Musca domestica]
MKRRSTGIFQIVAILGCLHLSLAQNHSEDLQQIRQIQYALNRNANPCVNFYEYACGNWSAAHPDDMEYDVESQLRQRHVLNYVEFIVEEYPLEEHTDEDYRQSFVDKSLAYFYSCIAEYESYDVLRYLEEIKPGPGLEWPLLEVVARQRKRQPYVAPNVWPVGKLQLFNLLGKLSSYGFESGLIAYEWTSQGVKGERVIKISLPEVPELKRNLLRKILREIQLPKQIVRKYYLDMVRIHQQLETFYANYISSDEADRTEYEIPYRGLKHDLQHLYGFISQIEPPNRHQAHSVALISDVDYFSKLLAEFRNPHRIQKLCNYLMLNFLIYLKYEQPSNCFYAIKNRLHLPFDYLFSKYFYQPQAGEYNSHLSLLSTKIYRNLFSLVKENRLDLTPEQMKGLRRQLLNVTSNIGNLPENINLELLEKIYTTLPAMDPENFYGNDLRALQHQTWLRFNCPNKVICQPQFPVLPTYDLTTNNVVIPFASLQLPIYHLDLDPLLSLSTFGFLLAQSYAKAINLRALQEQGADFANLPQHPHIKCMVQQEPTDFINERIADLMGARIAYQTYAQEYKYNLQPQFTSLPWKQLFFLNLAQTFCSKTPEDVAGQESDSAMVRLNQIAMNLEVFGEAFQCPMGSEMNPARKCRYL